MTDTFDFIVVGADPPARSSPPAFRRIPAAGWLCSRRAVRRRNGADAGGVRVAAARPRDRLDVHRRRRQLRARAGRGPDDGAPRQDARRLVGHQLHGLRARPSRGLRRVGGRRRHRLELRRGAARTSRRAKGSRRAATSSSTPTRTTPTGPLGVSVRAPVLRGCAGVRRRRGRRPASPRATTTAATAVGPTASCRCCRPPPATASGRAPTTRSSRARPSDGRTSTIITGAHVTRRPARGRRQAALTRDGRRVPHRRRRDRRSCGPPRRWS